MRLIIYVILVGFTFSSCSAQKVVNLKSKDVLVFNFKTDDVRLAKFYAKVYNQDGTYKETIESSENEEISNKENLVITQEWKPMGYGYYQKKYSFILDKDTMNISCKCGQFQNYYFKNLDFKKGNYELKFDFIEKYDEETKKHKPQIKYILGNEITTSKEVQNILFKNTYENSAQQDKYFRDLKFIEIDLRDTLNTKLIKIE